MERSALPAGGRILLTGATGQVGGELLQTLKPLGEVIAPARAEMDLARAASVRKTIRAVRPRWIVNPGAYTAVGKAESEPESGDAINAAAAKMTGEVIGQCEAVARGSELAGVLADVGGFYHAAGAGETTWYGFAAEAVRLQREREPAVRFADIEAITSAAYPTPAKRPANSRMDCSRLMERFGWKMMVWQG